MKRSIPPRFVLIPFLEALLLTLALAPPGRAAAAAPAREPVVGLPCEGCEAIFIGMPQTLAPEARIGSPGEPGEPLRITGAVFDRAGRPAPGIVVYAYQTDAEGHYPPGRGAARAARCAARAAAGLGEKRRRWRVRLRYDPAAEKRC